MKIRLSIRGVLGAWIVVGGAAILLLVVAGLTSTSRLAGQQDELLRGLVPAQAANHGVALALGEFLNRQTAILAAPDADAVDAIGGRDELEALFAGQRETLAAIAADNSDVDAAAQRLDAAYADILDTDTALLESRRRSLVLSRQLTGLAARVDATAAEIQEQADAIVGKLAFGAVMQKRRLKKALGAIEPDTFGSYDEAAVKQLEALVADSLEGDAASIQQASASLQSDSLALSAQARRMMLERSSDMLLSIRDNEITQLASRVTKTLDELAEASKTRDDLVEPVAALTESRQQLVDMLVGDDRSVFVLRRSVLEQEQAMTEVLTRAQAARLSITETLDGVPPAIDNMVAQAEERSASVVRDGRTILIVGGLVAVTLVLIFGALVMRLQKRIASVLSGVTSALTQAASGDLTRRLSLSGAAEFTVLVDAFNRFCENTRELIGGIQGSSGELRDASASLAAITEQTSSGSRRQRAETEQVAAAMEQMSATVQDVARHAVHAAEAAGEADSQGKQGHAVVEQVMSSIADLARRIDEAAEVVNRVEAGSHSIGGILDVIGAISAQTNLLALNAAIEAARAGEHGRGFSVVADEVRTLAARTHESTEEIRRMIDELRGGTRDAVEVMSSSTDLARGAGGDAERAGAALAAINSAVGTINEMNTQIASAAEEQSQVANDMGRNLNSIHEVAGQQVESAERTEAAGRQLATLAEALGQRVQSFRIEDGSESERQQEIGSP